ncbi:MAG TPA: DUF2079 domain-containing protein [Thermoanaerobaculia bacterium]|jgi:uncharacterized membrane protein
MKFLRTAAAAWLVLFAAFLATGPWQFGRFELKQINIVVALAFVLLIVAACARDVRRWYAEVLRRDVQFSKRALFIAAAGCALFFIAVVWSKWSALEVNAWDFSVVYDRPLERTLGGRVLYADEIERSMLGVHANWVQFLFVPLYAIARTPLWLLLAHALGIAAGVIAAFLFFREIARDDVVAVLLAAALLFNRYTAKATQYVFHPEVFYLAGLFLLYYSFVRQRRGLYALALLFVLSIKEDAIIPLIGFASVAALTYRRWRWAIVTAAAAIAVFAFDYFLVMPHYAPPAAETAWYANYWSTFGDTPLEAIGGMLRQPLLVASRVVSGSSDIFLSLALVPLAGAQWLIAALPGLVVYGSSDMEKLHWFTLYYSMPVLPAVFAAIPSGIQRIARFFRSYDARVVSRIAAMVVLVASIAVGSGHLLHPRHPDRHKIAPLIAESRAPVTWVQGALFPRAGYSARVQVLNERAQVDGRAAFLLAPRLDQYPYESPHVETLISQLLSDARYRRREAGALVLFVPR